MAYFTENSVQTNVFTRGDLDICLKEPDWDPNENDGKNMYPGYTVNKNPTVKNITSDKNGDEPCYVRMSVDILNSQGTPITDDQALNLIYKTIYLIPGGGPQGPPVLLHPPGCRGLTLVFLWKNCYNNLNLEHSAQTVRI